MNNLMHTTLLYLLRREASDLEQRHGSIPEGSLSPTPAALRKLANELESGAAVLATADWAGVPRTLCAATVARTEDGGASTEAPSQQPIARRKITRE